MTCSHGHEGYCFDEATPTERAAFDEAHAFAYAWAMASYIERDLAEMYAGWYAARVYPLPIEDWGSMPREWEAFEVSIGRRPAPKPYQPTTRVRRRRAA